MTRTAFSDAASMRGPERPAIPRSSRYRSSRYRSSRYRSSRLQVLSAARGRVLPDFVAVIVEHQSGIRWRGIPDVAGKLALKLPRRPATVAKRDEALLRAGLAGTVAHDLTARRATTGR